MKKGQFLNLNNITSQGVNNKVLNGIYRFDSFEKLDDNTTCYVTKKIGNGMNYLINVTDAEDSLILYEDLDFYGIKLSSQEKKQYYGR